MDFAKSWVNAPRAGGGSAGGKAGMDNSGLEDSAVLFCQATLLKLIYVIRLIVTSPTGTSADDELLCSQGEGSDVKSRENHKSSLASTPQYQARLFRAGWNVNRVLEGHPSNHFLRFTMSPIK